MAESLVLTTPVAGPQITSYRVTRLNLRRLPSAFIGIDVIDNNGLESSFIYEGDVAKTLLNQLNTMNFTSTSLEKRVLLRLISDGYLVGSVSGTPGD